jgi:hypothetical protein
MDLKTPLTGFGPHMRSEPDAQRIIAAIDQSLAKINAAEQDDEAANSALHLRECRWYVQHLREMLDATSTPASREEALDRAENLEAMGRWFNGWELAHAAAAAARDLRERGASLRSDPLWGKRDADLPAVVAPEPCPSCGKPQLLTRGQNAYAWRCSDPDHCLHSGAISRSQVYLIEAINKAVHAARRLPGRIVTCARSRRQMPIEQAVLACDMRKGEWSFLGSSVPNRDADFRIPMAELLGVGGVAKLARALQGKSWFDPQVLERTLITARS